MSPLFKARTCPRTPNFGQLKNLPFAGIVYPAADYPPLPFNKGEKIEVRGFQTPA
jgi:hypothetical protein